MAKKLFKHNEKTDFIMNMTEKSYQKMCYVFLMISAICISLSTLVYYFAKGNKHASFGSDLRYMAESLKHLQVTALFLMVLGFCGILVYLIKIMKKQYSFKDNKGIALVGIYLILAVISTLLAYSKTISLYGKTGRHEGLISIIAYIGLFLAATQLTDGKKTKIICDTIIGIGVLNAIAGIFQSFYSLDGIIPTFFTTNLFEQNLSFANGFTTSPFALAALLTMTLALSVNGLMYDDNKKKKLYYGLSSILFVAVGLLTNVLPAIVGMSVVLIASIISEITRLKTGHGLWKRGILNNPLGWAIICALGAGVVFLLIFATGNFKFYDAYIVTTDSLSRIGASNPRYTAVSGIDIYSKTWKEVWSVLKDNWLIGAGPDVIGFEKYKIFDLSSIVGSSDRAYNIYLNIAASTGIPSLLACLGFVAVTLKRGFKGIKNFFNLNGNWTKSAITIACIGYLAQGFFNISIITVSPIFFVLLGLAYGSASKSKSNSKSKTKEAK
ncbi:MAG: hypothetical protein GX896_06980 [Clostridiales bacterium]|nr:hypothetical protein [Clostridiales bacterium]